MTPIVPSTQPATLKTHPTSSTSSTRSTLRNLPPKISNMSTTTTIDTNEGWTYPEDNNPVPKFSTTTEPDNNWGIPPAAPFLPLSAVGHPHTNDHVSLHWAACYDDYCNTSRQMKDNNYYPRRGNNRCRRSHQQCNCPNAHPYELAEVICVRHLNPCKACADWQKGKRVCPDCRFLVNLNDHHLRCQSTAQHAPLADIVPPQEAPAAAKENPDVEGLHPPTTKSACWQKSSPRSRTESHKKPTITMGSSTCWPRRCATNTTPTNDKSRGWHESWKPSPPNSSE